MSLYNKNGGNSTIGNARHIEPINAIIPNLDNVADRLDIFLLSLLLCFLGDCSLAEEDDPSMVSFAVDVRSVDTFCCWFCRRCITNRLCACGGIVTNDGTGIFHAGISLDFLIVRPVSIDQWACLSL